MSRRSWGRRLSPNAERAQWEKRYLRERMQHHWAPAADPTACTCCGLKYTLHRSDQACPQRRRPNRYRIHMARAWCRAKAEIPQRPAMDGPGILAQLRAIEAEIKHTTGDDRWWKYSREARRYRRLLAAWWQLPARETTAALGPELRAATEPSRTGWITAGRNKLLKRAASTGQLSFSVEGCHYTIQPTAVIGFEAGIPLATFEAAQREARS